MFHRYQKLINLFNTARTHLKYPKISFNAKDDTGNYKVQLYLATKGYIAIKVDNVYVGKIQPYESIEGMQYSFRMYQGSTILQHEIESFCMNPLENAVAYGQAYSNCCFCGLELTNKASLQMGYGPICADNYGLPWSYTSNAEESNKLIDL